MTRRGANVAAGASGEREREVSPAGEGIDAGHMTQISRDEGSTESSDQFDPSLLISMDLGSFSTEKRLAIEDLRDFVVMFRTYSGVALMVQMTRRLPRSSILDCGLFAREQFASFLTAAQVPGFRLSDPGVPTIDRFRRIYEDSNDSRSSATVLDANGRTPQRGAAPVTDTWQQDSGRLQASTVGHSSQPVVPPIVSVPGNEYGLARNSSTVSKMIRSEDIFYMDEYKDKISYYRWKQEALLTFARAEVTEHHRAPILGMMLGGTIKMFYTDKVQYNKSLNDAFELLDSKVFTGEFHEQMVDLFDGVKFRHIANRMRNSGNKGILHVLYHDTLKYAQGCLPTEYHGERRLLRALRNAVRDESFASAVLLKDFNTADDLYAHLVGCINIQSRIVRPSLPASQPRAQHQLFTRDLRHQVSSSSAAGSHAKKSSAPFCRNCSSPEHLAMQCPEPPKCHNCGSTSHFIAQCSETLNQKLQRAPVRNIRALLFSNEDMQASDIDPVLESVESFEEHNASGHDNSIEDELFYSAVNDMHIKYEHLQSIASATRSSGAIGLALLSQRMISDFWGVCVDTGASSNFCSLPQWQAFCALSNSPSSLRPVTMRSVGLDIGIFRIIGTGEFRLPVSSDVFLTVDVDVLDTSKAEDPQWPPLVLGLLTMDHHSCFPNNLTDALVFPTLQIEIPLIRKFGKLFIDPAIFARASPLLTYAELRKIHRKFNHASSERIQRIFDIADQPLSENEFSILARLSRQCHICQRFSKAPATFRLSANVEVNFNHTVQLDTFYLPHTQGERPMPVMHIVCEGTRFMSGQWLKHDSTSGALFEIFFLCWISAYNGAPHIVKVDAGSAYASREFQALANVHGIHVDVQPIEGHQSIGRVERAHGIVGIMYEKMILEDPDADADETLAHCFFVANSSCGLSGIPPCLMVFGSMPRMVISSIQDVPSQAARINALVLARRVYEEFITKQYLNIALSRRHAALGSEMQDTGPPVPGDLVIIARERNRRRNYDGPYLCVAVDGHKVSVRMPPTGAVRIFHVARVRKYRIEPAAELLTQPISAREYRLNPDLQLRFKSSDEEELSWLYNQGAFIIAERVPTNAVIVPAKMVRVLKNYRTAHETTKSRLVALGHVDAQKRSLIVESPMLSQWALKVIVSTTVQFGWTIHTQDAKKAYLQATKSLQRPVYIVLRSVLCNLFCNAVNIPPRDILYLLVVKPLYGLSESGMYWWFSVQHALSTLSLVPTPMDPCFFIQASDGLVGVLSDNIIYAGTRSFLGSLQQKLAEFIMSPAETPPLEYNGVRLEQNLRMHQTEYLQTLRRSALEALTPEQFRGRIRWLGQTRPDLLPLSPSALDLADTAKRVGKYLAETERWYLPYDRLDADFRVHAYSDASFATDGTRSRLCFCIFLVDGVHRAHLLHARSYLSPRVVRSVLAAELYAASDCLDFCLALQPTLCSVHVRDVPITLFTDSQSIFDTVHKAKVFTEKRLMVDVVQLREAIATGELQDLAHLRASSNIADSLTKFDTRRLMWHQYFMTGKLDHDVHMATQRYSPEL
ncbi:hypothetical protein FVE85_4571 [Porphyridium purpureum]|uniref:Integrase catalytic domain-containing protein n=1 Tax=Porphyridium purpureum TaxID=35688 RepID=A0A5J4YI03_PORPP|nr:hypothetical protein FVE85_4571 [Porphyridium purpureum]|eukprot:POR7608..scf225_25